MIELVILTFATVVNIALGLVVYLNNPRADTNRFFLGLTIAFSLWSITNYLSVHPTIFSQIVHVRIALMFALLLSLFVYSTFKVFPDKKIRNNKSMVAALAYTLFVVLLTATPAVFTRLNDSSSATPAPVAGPGIVFFAFHTLFFLGSAFFFSARNFVNAQNRQKQQFKIVLTGLVLSFGLIIMNNFIIVAFLQKTFLIPLSPTYSLIFTGSFTYAIVRHRLLDVRIIVARALVYIAILAAIASLYGVLIFGFSRLALGNSTFSDEEFTLVVGVAIFVALSYQKIKNFFDKISNRIFFRDSYDSQQVLSDLSSALATEIDLVNIIRKSTEIINLSIRPSYVRFVVLNEDNSVFYDYGTAEAPSLGLNFLDINGTDEQVILKDQNDEINSGILDKSKADSILKLEIGSELVGVIVLGSKLSGAVYSNQDINLLIISEKELAIAVQNARYFDQIQKFNVTLQRKIKQATRRLEHSNQKLKELDEAKDEFISMASHQLRTPLTSIKGYVSMVLEGDAGKISKQQRKLLEEAFVSSQRMVYLIADLLNVSRLKTGKFIIEKTEVDLSELVESEIEQLQATARSRKLQLTYNKPAKFHQMMLDETKIRQVVMNFTDNAIYYTPAGGKIEVSLHAPKGCVEFMVKDTGIGVPKKAQPMLFSKFFRADNAKKARPDGTGLGLFMAKKVILAQGGSIIFESTEGEGSTFGFRLKR